MLNVSVNRQPFDGDFSKGQSEGGYVGGTSLRSSRKLKGARRRRERGTRIAYSVSMSEIRSRSVSLIGVKRESVASLRSLAANLITHSDVGRLIKLS